jgi:hypothetical protein
MAVLRRWSAVLVFLRLALPGAARAQAAREYDVKAAFLYNFTKFVEWPASAFDDERETLKLCVLGENPFGDALQAVVGEEVAGHRITVVRSEAISRPSRCHVLFVGRSERSRLPQILPEVRNAPVLTVADSPGFLEQGGMINFVLEGTKVRFEVNQGAAEREGIKISSKLLQLAKRVLPGARPGS